MQAAEKRKPRQLRRFKVGVVGASNTELRTIDRILTVTQYRTRGYEVVALNKNQLDAKQNVDIVAMFSENPTVVSTWDQRPYGGVNNSRPMLMMSRPQNKEIHGKYQIKSPINPSKLIKVLDQYTIAELNFLPEFEIGNNGGDLESVAFSGLEMLRSNGSESEKNPNSQNVQALVVDDSLAVRRQMQIEFELLKDDLDLAENAEKALSKIERKKYDIIFLDIVMPGMDGYTVCKQIRRNKLNKDTPVIMLTSRSGSFDKIKGTLAGCDAYLVKPINHNEFVQEYQKQILKQHRGKAHVSKQSASG